MELVYDPTSLASTAHPAVISALNSVSTYRPTPPRMTVLSSPKGRHANPRRGAKLVFWEWCMLCGSFAALAEIIGVGAMEATKSGLIHFIPLSGTTTAPRTGTPLTTEE